MRYNLFGSLSLERSGKGVLPVNSKAALPLRLLALRAGKPVRAENLQSLLRPPRTPAGTEQLPKRISEIRLMLADELGVGDDRLHRHGRGDALAYELRLLDGDTIDWDEFCNLIRQAEQALDSGRFGDALDLADQALKLGVSDPFLELADYEVVDEALYSYEDWTLTGRRVRAVAQVELDQATSETRHELETLIEQDDSNERLCEALLRATFRLGGEAAAREAAANCRALRESGRIGDLLKRVVEEESARAATRGGASPRRSPGTNTTGREPSPAERPWVLVVEDNDRLRKLIKDILAADHEVIPAPDLETAMDIITDPARRFDCAVVDQHLTDDLEGSGWDVLEQLARRHPDVPRILITANQRPGQQVTLTRRYGLFEMLIKSPNGQSVPQLRVTVEAALAMDPRGVRRRARSRLHVAAGNYRQVLRDRLLEADDRQRRNVPDAAQEIATWEALLELLNLEEDRDEQCLGMPECEDPDGTVQEFMKRWNRRLRLA